MQYQSGVVSPIESIKEGWKLIENNYWTFVLMTLLLGVILFVVALILGLVNNGITFGVSAALGSGGIGTAEKVVTALIPQVVSLVVSLFTNVIVIGLSGAMLCGIYSALSKTAKGHLPEIGDLFSGFQHFTACAIVGAVMSLLQFVIGLIALLVGAAIGVSAGSLGVMTSDGKLNPALLGGALVAALGIIILSLVFNILIQVLTTFVYPLISERNLSGGEALKISCKSGLANFGGLLILVILMFFMALGGILLCFIGILFVAPILFSAIFVAYQSVFGKVNDSSYFETPPAPPSFGQQRGY